MARSAREPSSAAATPALRETSARENRRRERENPFEDPEPNLSSTIKTKASSPHQAHLRSKMLFFYLRFFFFVNFHRTGEVPPALEALRKPRRRDAQRAQPPTRLGLTGKAPRREIAPLKRIPGAQRLLRSLNSEPTQGQLLPRLCSASKSVSCPAGTTATRINNRHKQPS